MVLTVGMAPQVTTPRFLVATGEESLKYAGTMITGADGKPGYFVQSLSILINVKLRIYMVRR